MDVKNRRTKDLLSYNLCPCRQCVLPMIIYGYQRRTRVAHRIGEWKNEVTSLVESISATEQRFSNGDDGLNLVTWMASR
ncbi:hypothetical protein EVAR_18937_1 [Eumeta japonica]|uniref:Uncharacterized protein n=1 Tax=Eumeta variegata TaxID=151549 RepID=A0A4C1V407_EUMVA|nr:hypothetical protein EVAR_18937_1 [Eumeta japonica]